MKKNLLIILGVISVVLVSVILILNQLGLLVMITNTTPWVDEESRATWDGDWNAQYPATFAFDENWGTATVLHDAYKEANIYEYFTLDYPGNAMINYLEFQVMYNVDHIPSAGKDVYASIKYYVWNYRTSSWDKVHSELTDTGVVRPFFKVSTIDHIKNNEVRLRTQAKVGFLQAVWVYEAKVRLGYSLEVDCNIGETKCDGANNREYFTCENYEWKNLGPTIGQCGAECLVDANCPGDSHLGEKYCSNNLVQKYRDYSCVNYQCDYLDIEKIIETCEFGCENGECNIAPPPRPGIIEWIGNIFKSIVDWVKGLFRG